MTRTLTIFAAAMLMTLHIAGCQAPELNPNPPAAEAEILGEPLQLTRNFARAGESYFSPDMQWIIFQASTKPDQDYEMYVAQLKWGDGGIVGLNTPIRISPAGSWNSCGYFSPDGNSLIFSSTRTAREKEHTGPATSPTTQRKGGYQWPMPSEAEIYRVDGWKGAIGGLEPGGSADLAQRAITQNNGYDAECGFSPDGQWIVYCSNVTGDPELWAMRADGSNAVQLTKNPGYDGGPFFAPDGKRICYRSDRKGNSLLQIYVADLEFDPAGNIVGLRNEQQITHNAAVNFGPFWHPDDHHLIWGTSLHGQSNFELYLMRDDGAFKTRVTYAPEADLLPVFSPDGKYVMWTSRRGPDKTSQIWVAKFRMPKGV